MDTSRTAVSWIRNSFVFCMCFVLWLLLAGSIDIQELAAGGFVSAVVVLVSVPHLKLLDGVRWSPASVPALLRFIGVFLLALFKANLDMARRVLSPSLPICPGMVEVQTRLESDLGRLFLANSITLTPGTLTIDINDNRLLVHWIDCTPGTDLESATQNIVAQFESHLLEFLH